MLCSLIIKITGTLNAPSWHFSLLFIMSYSQILGKLYIQWDVQLCNVTNTYRFSQSTATLLHYRCVDYLPTATQCNVLHFLQVKIDLTLLQYLTAVVGAEMAILSTATYCNTAAVDYTRSIKIFKKCRGSNQKLQRTKISFLNGQQLKILI